jgi:hypothetical protein
MPASISRVGALLRAIRELSAHEWSVIESLHCHVAEHRVIALQMPTITNMEGLPLMANYVLGLDKVATFTITETNAAGTVDPVAPADVFTVVNTDTVNLNAVVGVNAAGQPALVVNWLHTTAPLTTGVSVTLTDSAGNTAAVQLFDMAEPVAHDQIGLDVAGVTTTTQAIPV